MDTENQSGESRPEPAPPDAVPTVAPETPAPPPAAPPPGYSYPPGYGQPAQHDPVYGWYYPQPAPGYSPYYAPPYPPGSGAPGTPAAPGVPVPPYAPAPPPGYGYPPGTVPYYPQPYPPPGTPYTPGVPYYPPYQYAYARRNPNSKGRCFGRGIIPPVIFMGFGIIFSVIYAVVRMVLYMTAHAEESRSIQPETLIDLVMREVYLISAISGFLCLIAFFFMHRKSKARFANDTELPRSGPGVLAVVCLSAVAFNLLVTSLIAFLPERLTGSGEITGPYWQYCVAVVLVAPFVEEYCFRLLAFNHFRRGIRFWPANFLQAGLFGLAHMNVLQSLYAFALGLFLGWIYERTRNVWAPILTHLFFNGIAAALPFLFGNAEINVLWFLIPSAAASAGGLYALRRLTRANAEPIVPGPALEPTL